MIQQIQLDRLARYREFMKTPSTTELDQVVVDTLTPDATLRMCHPFGDLKGPNGWSDACLWPLLRAMPDLERRDMIVIINSTDVGDLWVGCMGNYFGTWLHPFLDIPPTGHLAHMRYHEFFRLENDRVAEMQTIWDVPELMMVAGAWPMAPQLGAFMCTPGPMSNDGQFREAIDGEQAMQHVIDMLTALCRYPGNPDPAVMQLERYWHPRFNWYGPAGIGTTRGVAGFRHWHQAPFLRAMPDRKLDAVADLKSHWFANGD